MGRWDISAEEETLILLGRGIKVSGSNGNHENWRIGEGQGAVTVWVPTGGVKSDMSAWLTARSNARRGVRALGLDPKVVVQAALTMKEETVKAIPGSVMNEVMGQRKAPLGPKDTGLIVAPPSSVERAVAASTVDKVAREPVETTLDRLSEILLEAASLAEGSRFSARDLVGALAAEKRRRELAEEKARESDKLARIREAETAKFNGHDWPKENERLMDKIRELDLAKKALEEQVAHLKSALRSLTLAGGGA